MLNPDFRDILLCLKEEKAEFLIVGAYALAAHGLPRATGDIDIWVRNSPENARRIVRALLRFGAPSGDISENDFTFPNRVVQLGVEPCRIDLLTSVDGVTFDVAWKNRVRVNIDDVEVSIMSKSDLLKNKSSIRRDKDLSDIAWLERNQD
jgi:hypothetical protein